MREIIFYPLAQQELNDAIGYYKTQDKAISTLPDAKITYWDLDFTQPTLILLGNEGQGLSSELIDLADEAVNVPLSNGVESLNLAVTAALLMYEAKRQRRS